MARRMRQTPIEEETPQREGEQDDQHVLDNDTVSTSDAPPDLPHLGLRLIADLSACVQRVSSDLAQAQDAPDAGDLELARQRWAQQLHALADLAAGNPAGQRASLLPSETPLHALPPYPRRAGTTQPITTSTRVPVDSSDDPAAQAMGTTMPINPPLPASYRWVPLTVREREVLRLWQRGYSPRRIALRLVISVETVYTHTRNIRRKQRAWEQAQQGEQAKQAKQANPALPTPPAPEE